MSDFVEVETAELIGPALDWAVAKATGELDADVEIHPAITSKAVVIDLRFEHAVISMRPCPTGWCFYMPSTSWAQGGPLIGKYHIMFEDDVGQFGCWVGEVSRVICGDTHLIAACRAIVAAKLGDTVSVPKELLP